MKPTVQVRPISKLTREEYIKLYKEWKELSKLSTLGNYTLLEPMIIKIKNKLTRPNKEVLYQGKRIATTTREFVSLRQKIKYLQSYRRGMQQKRNEARELMTETRNVLGYKYEVAGGVRVTPITQLKREHHPKFAREYKKPQTQSNYVGIEMEMVSDINLEQMAMLLAINKLDHKIRVMSDGSIRATEDCEYTFELNIIDTEYNIKNTLDKLEKVIKGSGFRFESNSTCGTHIHFDVRNRDAYEIYEKLYYSLDTILKTVHPSRLDNKYCKRNKTDSLVDATSDYSGSASRYQMINPEAVRKHNTIEVRVFEGTLDFNKIKAWLDMCLGIINTEALKAVSNV